MATRKERMDNPTLGVKEVFPDKVRMPGVTETSEEWRVPQSAEWAAVYSPAQTRPAGASIKNHIYVSYDGGRNWRFAGGSIIDDTCDPNTRIGSGHRFRQAVTADTRIRVETACQGKSVPGKVLVEFI